MNVRVELKPESPVDSDTKMSSSFPAAASPIVDAFTPASPLTASFGGNVIAEGAAVSPALVAERPTVHFDGSAEKHYTFILSDPDAPNPTEPKFAEWIHWLSVNNRVDGAVAGEDLVAFFGSAPGQGAGIHRYVLVVYEQAGVIATESESRIPLQR